MKRLLALCLALAVATTARAAVPDPAQSFVPCFSVCPLGDIAFPVYVRDLAGNPINGAFVQVLFCESFSPPNLAFCVSPEPCAVSAFTGPTGFVQFNIKAGAVDSHEGILVRADGVLLATRSNSSPDQNGDRVVNGADVVIGTAALGSSSVTMDLDCDGGVDVDDLDRLNQHYGHTCGGPVPARPNSWGRVKILYR